MTLDEGMVTEGEYAVSPDIVVSFAFLSFGVLVEADTIYQKRWLLLIAEDTVARLSLWLDGIWLTVLSLGNCSYSSKAEQVESKATRREFCCYSTF